MKNVLQWLNQESSSTLQANGVVPPLPNGGEDTCSNSQLTVSTQCSRDLALVQVQTPPDGPKQSKTVVIVIDASYSMDEAAKMYNDSEGAAGLSILDVVKFAVCVILELFSSDHQLAIVSYADTAETVFPVRPINAITRQEAKDAVNRLVTRGSTNLWGGLAHALEMVENVPNSEVMLLTDGLPNIHPPRGEQQTLERYLESHPKLDCGISTFGFGYQLDSSLLRKIAEQRQGYFGFIPDASFVGTVFINSVSNILAEAVSGATLSVEVPNGTTVECLSGQSFTKTAWGGELELPSLIYGQTMQVLFKLNGHDRSPTVRVKTPTGMSISQIEQRTDEVAFREAQARSLLTEFIQSTETEVKRATSTSSRDPYSRSTVVASNAMSIAKPKLKALKEKLGSLVQMDHGIAKDVYGQVSEAYSRLDWYTKWGRHYLNSLLRAHVLQKCSNFKDPGVQPYATAAFRIFRDRAEAIFSKLPPPTPSRTRDARLPALTSMADYYDCGTPCFASGHVLMADNSRCSVQNVTAGDVVATSKGPAKVLCVIATQCEGDLEALVELEDSVLVTPWHPVRNRHTKDFQFPAYFRPPLLRICHEVYSFVLEKGATDMIIGGYETITLGHGIQDDPVAAHDYLGTMNVVEDLSRMAGWSKGRVQLEANPAIRDPDTHRIVGFRQFSNESNKNDPLVALRGGKITF